MRRPQYQVRQRRCSCSGETSFRVDDLDMDACTRWRTRAARACDSGGIWGSSLPIVSRQQAPEPHAWPASYDNSTCVNFSPSFLPHHHLQRNDFSLLSESSNQQRLRTQRTTTITPRPPRNAAIDRSSHRHSDSATSKNIITSTRGAHDRRANHEGRPAMDNNPRKLICSSSSNSATPSFRGSCKRVGSITDVPW
jgi:hypothetical protein